MRRITDLGSDCVVGLESCSLKRLAGVIDCYLREWAEGHGAPPRLSERLSMWSSRFAVGTRLLSSR